MCTVWFHHLLLILSYITFCIQMLFISLASFFFLEIILHNFLSNNISLKPKVLCPPNLLQINLQSCFCMAQCVWYEWKIQIWVSDDESLLWKSHCAFLWCFRWSSLQCTFFLFFCRHTFTSDVKHMYTSFYECTLTVCQMTDMLQLVW